MNEMRKVFGKVHRWRDGERLWAKNNWVAMVYVVTDDPAKVGNIALHGPDQLFVEFIDAEKARLWVDA